jgi:nucleoside-diphosphate-sugar epimerase
MWNYERFLSCSRRKRYVKALVTGAAGFVGNHLVEMLVERGDEVRALVQPCQNTDCLRTLPSVEVTYGDLTDPPSLKRAVQGVQLIYHIAAKTGPWGPEKAYQATNVQGLADLIFAAMEAGVHRIVHTSSITVYGHHLRGIVTEDHPYHAENNPYSRTKIAGEKLIFRLVKEHRAPVVIVRPAWIYGPRDRASFARFVNLVASGKGWILGNGNNIVPVVYVRDVAQGLIKAGDAGDEAVGRAYNIADDRRVTQAEYLNTIADALKVPRISRKLPFSAIYFAGRSAEALWRVRAELAPALRLQQTPPPLTTYGVTLLGGDQRFSINRARRELGYVPQIDVKRGVAEGVQWYLSQTT